MKVLFIVNAVHHWERIGILTLSSVLKENGHETFLLNINNKSNDQVLRTVSDYHPHILAYSSMSTEIEPFLRVNSFLKDSLSFDVKSVFGGPHPTFYPEVIEDPPVDAICRGEGEIAFLKYISFLNGQLKPESVENFIIQSGSSVITNGIAPWPGDLDDIPFPDRALWDDIDSEPSHKSFFSSRGCPYKCTYCFNHKYNEMYGSPKKIVRRRSVDNFLSEIKQTLRCYPNITPFFDDDSFIMAPTSWLREFQEKYVSGAGVPFACNIRPDQASEEKIKLLSESGCFMCWFGLECGDEQFSNSVMKRNLKNEKIIFTAKMLKKYKIRFATQNINALPSQDPITTDLKTLELNIKCAPDFAMAHIFFPFPRTELGTYTSEKGLFDSDIGKLNDPLCTQSPLNFDPRTKKKLERQNKLFALVVGFPILRHFLPLLRNLPLGKLFTILNLLYGGYCTRIKLQPAKKGIKYYLSLLALFRKKILTF